MSSLDSKSYDIHHNRALSRQSVLLTGGASRRMGTDKASLMIDGEALAPRLARLLRAHGWEPTVLGKAPLSDYRFQEDATPNAGPLVALRAFAPTCDFVLVLSCDLPRFDPRIGQTLLDSIGGHDAAIPIIGNRLQPLCALYRKSAWNSLASIQSVRIMDWITLLHRVEVAESQLAQSGIPASAAHGVNTPEEFAQLLSGNADAMD